MDRAKAIKALMDLIDEAKKAEETALLNHKEQKARLDALYEIWDVLLNDGQHDRGNRTE